MIDYINRMIVRNAVYIIERCVNLAFDAVEY